ncbi:hypothetical protein [Streptomyces sp.]|uniref:hypothetical protein n=1 Tax=Streptomyces sp. TaxID=1931 RepID=UPI0028124B50|nr:hypothetical protein [Streptomyces sp.]
MYAYEMHRVHHAELVREAAARRLAHEAGAARRGRRLFGRRSGGPRPAGRVSDGDRDRFARAA